MDDSCLWCLFAQDDMVSIMIDDMLNKNKYMMSSAKHKRCVNENSPYYDELVSEDKSCRSYIDARQYFKMKDRKENIEELKNKILMKQIRKRKND